MDVGRDPRPYVVVSTLQRNAVYQISKTTKLLQPTLDSQNNTRNAPACSMIKLCDSSGAWFPWELRDAAVATGLVYSERSFQEFFGEIATNIEVACKTKVFPCTKTPILVGSKLFDELPLNRVINFSLSNFEVMLPRHYPAPQNRQASDSFRAPEDVINQANEVVRYAGSDSYTPSKLESISKTLTFIEKIYVTLNWIVLILAILGLVLGIFRKLHASYYFAALFLILGIPIQLIGVSLAQVSFGTNLGSPTYLLEIYPLHFMLACLGIAALFGRHKEMPNGVTENSAS